MTRKDYIFIANVIKKHRQYPNTDVNTIDSLVQSLAQEFKNDNQRFNWIRFEQACK